MLKHGRIGIMRPEQFPMLFHVYEQDTNVSDRGRTRLEPATPKASIRCILSIAKPDEMERFNQLGVKVTHTLIQRGTPVAKEQNILVLVKNGKESRWFRIQAVHNKGELDIDTAYYCEERNDLR